jgi:predicted TIM-barrel fold metal-dependent hydrolase
MLDVEAILGPHYDCLVSGTGGLALFDAHTHIGFNDPDGFKQTREELIARLDAAGARGVVFPMHEPGGYRAANDAVLEAAADSGGRVVAYCRVDPRDGALAEATRALDAGARGIKLHPRAEQFGLSEPAVRELVALAHDRRVPLLIHAGRGIPALGRHTVALSAEFPDAKLILAHAAISDLAWLWRVLPEHPNLFVDTAWWNPADLIALFTLAPPAQILWASDSPYGLPMMSAVIALRCARQAGLGAEALRSIAGGQMERLLAGEPGADAGPPPRQARALNPLLERVVTHLVTAMGRAFARTDPDEAVALARLACAVGEDAEDAPVFAAVLELLDHYAANRDEPPTDGRPYPPAGRFMLTALAVARTPDVPLPERPQAPPPTRAEAERASGA